MMYMPADATMMPVTSGTSRAEVAATRSPPRPGRANTVSITAAPENSAPSAQPDSVMPGSTA